MENKILYYVKYVLNDNIIELPFHAADNKEAIDMVENSRITWLQIRKASEEEDE